jgi:Fe-S-cluster containining protein
VLDLLATLFGPKIRLPGDQVTRIRGAAKKAGQAHADQIQKIVDAIGGLEGIADVAKTKRLPRGFYDLVDRLVDEYDAYLAAVAQPLDIAALPRAGTAEGKGACYAGPFGVSGIESLRIYRRLRAKTEFPRRAEAMAKLGQLLFEDIQAHHKGKDPEKIRMGGKAAQLGRRQFAARGHLCPMYDEKRQRCGIWEIRPIACRMHHIQTDPAWSDPRHDHHARVVAKNVRLPIRQQVALAQIDKRMGLNLSPFLYAALLQIVQLTEGELLQELGEAPIRMGQDGRIAERANRNRPGAKKFQKKGKR